MSFEELLPMSSFSSSSRLSRLIDSGRPQWFLAKLLRSQIMVLIDRVWVFIKLTQKPIFGYTRDDFYLLKSTLYVKPRQDSDLSERS